MPQFRLTTKMAKKLKIEKLAEPIQTAQFFYDDWAVDLVRAQRKEVAIFMHIETRMALAVPLYEIGGAKFLFDCFPILLEWHLNELSLDIYEDFGLQVRNYFDPKLNKFHFCKTDNRSVTAHINQFKAILEHDTQVLGLINQQTCDNSIEYWQGNLITTPNHPEFTTPAKLWEALSLNKTDCTPQQQNIPDNVIIFPKKLK